MHKNQGNGLNGHQNGIHELSREDGIKLLDKQTRQYLHMSAVEFIDAWQGGRLRDRQEEPHVARLASLIPLAT